MRAQAVQTFVVKAIALRAATGFVDPDLSTSPGTTKEQKECVLGPLYERHVEYPEILAAQGMVSEALRYVERVPTGFRDVQWSMGAFAGSGSTGEVHGSATEASTGVKDGQGAYGGATYGGPHPFRISIPASSPILQHAAVTNFVTLNEPCHSTPPNATHSFLCSLCVLELLLLSSTSA